MRCFHFRGLSKVKESASADPGGMIRKASGFLPILDSPASVASWDDDEVHDNDDEAEDQETLKHSKLVSVASQSRHNRMILKFKQVPINQYLVSLANRGMGVRINMGYREFSTNQYTVSLVSQHIRVNVGRESGSMGVAMGGEKWCYQWEWWDQS